MRVGIELNGLRSASGSKLKQMDSRSANATLDELMPVIMPWSSSAGGRRGNSEAIAQTDEAASNGPAPTVSLGRSAGPGGQELVLLPYAR